MNQLKTFFLMALLTVLFVWVGDLVGGRDGAIFALVMAALMNFGVYWFSDKIVLRMYGAQEVTEAEAPGLHRIVREEGGDTHAAGLRHELRFPQRLCHRAQPRARCCGRHKGHHEVAR